MYYLIHVPKTPNTPYTPYTPDTHYLIHLYLYLKHLYLAYTHYIHTSTRHVHCINNLHCIENIPPLQHPAWLAQRQSKEYVVFAIHLWFPPMPDTAHPHLPPPRMCVCVGGGGGGGGGMCVRECVCGCSIVHVCVNTT